MTDLLKQQQALANLFKELPISKIKFAGSVVGRLVTVVVVDNHVGYVVRQGQVFSLSRKKAKQLVLDKLPVDVI